MANIKYFYGMHQLKNPHSMDNKDFAARFPGATAKRYDGYSKWVGTSVETGELMPVERLIEFKGSPSLHACDARCLNANGKIMRCECSCGGKNHGRGMFSSLVQAA